MVDKYKKAIELFDAANALGPEQEEWEGQSYPKELLYAQRMSHCLDEFCPDAKESLRLAARSQHICRWEIPRKNYPMDRIGYLQWRKELYKFHANKAGELLAQAGYGADSISRVQFLLHKQGLKRDKDAQTLEDVACLVFLRYYLTDLMKKHEASKIQSILDKTWKKMSPNGQKAAEKINLPNLLP